LIDLSPLVLQTYYIIMTFCQFTIVYSGNATPFPLPVSNPYQHGGVMLNDPNKYWHPFYRIHYRDLISCFTAMGLLTNACLTRFFANLQASSIETNVGMNPVIIQRAPSIISIMYRPTTFLHKQC